VTAAICEDLEDLSGETGANTDLESTSAINLQILQPRYPSTTEIQYNIDIRIQNIDTINCLYSSVSECLFYSAERRRCRASITINLQDNT
jgi:hypothetical protein